MSIKMQITQLGLSVDEFAHCVDSLDEQRFLEKINHWSARDMVAHLVGWNRYIIVGSKQIIKRELPFYDIDPGENYSNVNAVLIRRYASRDKKELLEDLQVSARELKQFLQTLAPGEWAHDYGVRHRGAIVTIKNTIDELIEDYHHHRKQIKAWKKHPRGV